MAAPRPNIHTGLSDTDFAKSSLATITQEEPSAFAQQSPTLNGEATGPQKDFLDL